MRNLKVKKVKNSSVTYPDCCLCSFGFEAGEEVFRVAEAKCGELQVGDMICDNCATESDDDIRERIMDVQEINKNTLTRSLDNLMRETRLLQSNIDNYLR